MKRLFNALGWALLASLAHVGALLALAGALALAFSPLILLLLAVWGAVRLARRDSTKNRAGRGATITG